MTRFATTCAIAASLVTAGCTTTASESQSDASFDAAGDASPVDAADAAAPCAPGDVSSFAPTWRPPTGAHQGKCSAAQLDAFYTGCLADTATQASCAPFGKDGDAADRACAACIVSKPADPTLGAIVVYPLAGGSASEIDFAGCVALVDPSAADCAKKYQAGVECEHAACDGVCRGDDQAAFADYEGCRGAANIGACNAYTTAGHCVFDLGADAGDGGAAGDATSFCLSPPTFEALYRAIAPLFCGL